MPPVAQSSKLIFARLNAVLIVLATVACLRLPGLVWPVISDDEAIYDAMAHVMNSGGIIYRDAVDHKPPGLGFVYALLERPFIHMNPVTGDYTAIFVVHLFGILLAVLTAYGLYLVARELYERRPELWLVPPLLYGIVTTSKCAIDGLAVNGELLMNLPIVFAILAVIKGAGKGSGRGIKIGAWRLLLDLSAGVLMGLAGLCKWQAMVAGVAFPFLGVMSAKDFCRRVIFRGSAWISGLIFPFTAVYFYFKGHGVLADAKLWGIFNFIYISEGPGFLWGLKRFAIQFGALILPSIVFYGCALKGGIPSFAGIEEGPRSDWTVYLGLCLRLGRWNRGAIFRPLFPCRPSCRCAYLQRSH